MPALMPLDYYCVSYEDLTNDLLYDILKLRQEVFIVEQECAYLDCDEYDREAEHMIGVHTEKQIIAYARLLPPDTIYEDYASFGRVLVVEEFRDKGHGREITEEALNQIDRLYGTIPVKIMAQTYLKPFYKTLDFKPEGDPFLEDGIEHQYMVLD